MTWQLGPEMPVYVAYSATLKYDSMFLVIGGQLDVVDDGEKAGFYGPPSNYIYQFDRMEWTLSEKSMEFPLEIRTVLTNLKPDDCL